MVDDDTKEILRKCREALAAVNMGQEAVWFFVKDDEGKAFLQIVEENSKLALSAFDRIEERLAELSAEKTGAAERENSTAPPF